MNLKQNFKMKRPKFLQPRPQTLADMNAIAAYAKSMPRWRYVLNKGWPNLLNIGTFSALVMMIPVPWMRVVLLMVLVLNAIVLGAIPEKWFFWQCLPIPTVEQAERRRDEIREMAEEADDPFDAQMLNESALQLDRWINGTRE